MKLYEEFKLFENMWDDHLTEEKEFRSEYAKLISTPEGRAELNNMMKNDRKKWLELVDADKAVDQVEQALKNAKDIELEYEGFSDDWFEDRFDPGSWWGHYQDEGSCYYPDYTYKVDARDMLETLGVTILPKYAAKFANNELVKEWQRLDKAWENSTDETEDEANEAIDLFIIKNMESFVDLFLDQIIDYYADDAREYAINHLEPDYD